MSVDLEGATVDPPVPGVKPPVEAELIWERELIFNAKSGSVELKLDSAGAAGPSPMQALAFALAGCMSMDVVHILQKGRHDLHGLRTVLKARRADEDPRRFVAVDLRFEVNGSIKAEQIERAVALSKDKYCSVWQSLRQDIDFNVTIGVTDPPSA